MTMELEAWNAFSCDTCQKCFKEKRYLQRHHKYCLVQNLKTKPKSANICEHCQQAFKRPAELRRHIMHLNRDTAYPCDKCSKSFVQKSHLNRHLRSVHTKLEEKAKLTIFCCSHCPKKFQTEWELRRHNTSMHTTTAYNRYKCRYCDALFDDPRRYARHLDDHNGLKNFLCHLCSEPFTSKLGLQRHTSAKHGIGQFYKCLLCSVEFSQPVQLDRHLEKIHSTVISTNDDSKTSCSICLLSFDENHLTTRQHFKQAHCVKIFKQPQITSLLSSSDVEKA